MTGEKRVSDGEKEATSGRATKKRRLVWTPELHVRFMSAVNHLGIANAVPKTILQLMNVEGMTRENVASHLQKYRLYLKRLAGVPPNAPLPPDVMRRAHPYHFPAAAAFPPPTPTIEQMHAGLPPSMPSMQSMQSMPATMPNMSALMQMPAYNSAMGAMGAAMGGMGGMYASWPPAPPAGAGSGAATMGLPGASASDPYGAAAAQSFMNYVANYRPGGGVPGEDASSSAAAAAAAAAMASHGWGFPGHAGGAWSAGAGAAATAAAMTSAAMTSAAPASAIADGGCSAPAAGGPDAGGGK